MRYVRNHDSYDDETLQLAETLFERFVGRRLLATIYTERVAVDHNRCHLRHAPVVEILAVKASIGERKVVPWSMEDTLSIGDVRERDGIVSLPSSLFDVSYDSAHITYIAGYEDYRSDVEACVIEIYDKLRVGTLSEWGGSQALSADAQATIARYRGGENHR